MFEDFVTWEILGTYANTAAMTALVVQFLKPLIDKYLKIPTQIISYVVALILLLAIQFFTVGLNGSAIALTFLNAFIISTSSNGLYDGVQRIMKGRVNK